MPNHAPSRPTRYRSIWISDVHLGSPECSAHFLLAFLHAVECKYLYLVGDIIDIHSMKRRPYWPQSHNEVLRTILGKAEHGTQIVYVPGNHDDLLREYDGMKFGNVRIQNKAVHVNANGQRFLILHGDEFDSIVRHPSLIDFIGRCSYDCLLRISHVLNVVRRRFGFGYWSLAAFIKHTVNNAVKYIGNFERVVAREATKLGVDGVVCGHIHRPQLAEFGKVLYCNCGDWVESCTALVEHDDGMLELLHWSDTVASAKRHKKAA